MFTVSPLNIPVVVAKSACTRRHCFYRKRCLPLICVRETNALEAGRIEIRAVPSSSQSLIKPAVPASRQGRTKN